VGSGSSLSAYAPTPDVTQQLGYGTNNHPATCAGMTAAYNDWKADTDKTYLVQVLAGSVLTTTGACFDIVPKLVSGNRPTKYIIFQSSTPLTAGQTVCSHDFKSDASRNADCSSPNDKASMWTMELTAVFNTGIIRLYQLDANGNAPNHIIFRDLEVRPQAGLSGTTNGLLVVGDGPTTVDWNSVPQNIGIDRVWVHGDLNDCPAGVCSGSNSIRNTLQITACLNCWIINSQTSRFFQPATESHALTFIQAKQVKIENNWLEGGSISSFCGGSANYIAGTNNCEDMEYRKNRFTYPAGWMSLADPAAGSRVRKNAFEFKSCLRCVVAGNIMENSDQTGGQAGKLLQLRASAFSNGVTTNYQFTVGNIYLWNNIIRHGCGDSGQLFNARSGSHGSSNGDGTSQGMTNVQMVNNLFYDMQATSASCTGSQSQTGWNSGDNPLTCTAARDSGGVNSTLTCTGIQGSMQTNMLPGDVVMVQDCVDTTFNTPQTTGQPQTIPLALPGTVPTALTVSYANSGTGSATTTGCTLHNGGGYPAFILQSHNTFIQGPTGLTRFASQEFNSAALKYVFRRNVQMTDNMFGASTAVDCYRSGFGVGTAPTNVSFDTSTLKFHHNVCGGTAANYTEWPGAISPPTTIWFPTVDACPTTTPATTCWGVFGAMNTATMPQNLADWHNYRLCKSTDAACNNTASSYAAGQARQSSDGKDVGFDSSLIDTEMSATKFTCTSACGTGPGTD
jgi:hypothetical protein